MCHRLAKIELCEETYFVLSILLVVDMVCVE